MTGQFQNMTNSDIYSMDGFDLYVVVKAPFRLSDTGTCGCFPVCILILYASLNLVDLNIAYMYISPLTSPVTSASRLIIQT